MALRLQRLIRTRTPVVAGGVVVSQLPLEFPIMADWAWWDFGMLAIGCFLIMWGFAPEIRKAVPITINIIGNGSERGAFGMIFVVFLFLLLAGYVKLLGEHGVMRAEYERLFEYQKSRIEELERGSR